jgi:8-oxo-dGTP diphosphatase
VAGADFLEPRLWHASLAGVIVAAAALIRDDGGAVLIVKPNYRDHWTLPGGVCEPGEPPHAGCAREVAEEVGLDAPIGRLLAVDWQQPPAEYGPAARPSMFFVFDGGRYAGRAPIVLQEDELDDFRFAPPAELSGFLAGPGLRRTMAAITSLASGVTSYLPHEPGRRPG